MKNQEYREIIQRFAKDRTNQRVPNGAPAHASVLLETMFQHASAEIRLFTRELHQGVFGQEQIIEAAKGFLSKPYARLSILLQKAKDDSWALEHPFLMALREQDGSHGVVEVVNAHGSYTEDDANHFAVMDNDGYRFELDHDKCVAVANFNEPKVAKQLKEAFDSAFSSAKGNGGKILYLTNSQE